MIVTETDISHYAPGFTISINGKEFSADVSKTILSLTITQEINKTNNFSFEVQDEFRYDFQDKSRPGPFKWLGHDIFKYGNNVSIEIGYLSNMHKAVDGKIQSISANFSGNTAPTFKVEGSDSAYEFLTKKSDSEVFRDKKDSEIVKQIAQMENANLEAVVDKTDKVFPAKTKKGGESYIKFLTDMAKSNPDYEFSLSGRKLFFVKAKKEKGSILTLKWGKELINFRSNLDISQAITGVTVRGWDRTGKKRIETSVKAGEETKQEGGKQLASEVAREIYGDVVEVITETPVSSVDEARNIAKSRIEEASKNFINGSAETIGIPELRPGVCVAIEGLGKWFSGKYYLEKVTHIIDKNGYRTKFDGKRNAV